MKKIILATIIATATAAFIYANTTTETALEVQATPIKIEAPILLAKAETPVAKVMEEVTKIKTEAPILLAEAKTQVISVTKKVSTTLAEKQLQRETTIEAELAKKETLRIENTKQREARLKKLNDDLQVKADTRAGIIY